MSSNSPSPALLSLFRIAALLTFAAVAMGAVVCATESGAACPNWPGCYSDQVLPVGALSPWIEFTHRLVAGLTTPTLLVTAVLAQRARLAPSVVRLVWVALAGALAAGVFGMMIILFHLPWTLGMLDLASALICMIAMGTAALLAQSGPRTWQLSPTGRLAWIGVAMLVVMHVLGIAVAGEGSFTRCVGWPVLTDVGGDRWPALQVVRLVMAVTAAALLVISVRRALSVPRLRAHALVLAGLFIAELVIGLLLRAPGSGEGLRTAYSVIAVALLWCWSLLAGRSCLRARHGEPSVASVSISA